jgi:hypothetical protein
VTVDSGARQSHVDVAGGDETRVPGDSRAEALAWHKGVSTRMAGEVVNAVFHEEKAS